MLKSKPLYLSIALLSLLGAMSVQAQQTELVIAGEGSGSNLAPLVKDFAQKHQVKVRFITQGKEELLNFLEKAPADVVVTSVSDELEIAKTRGLLQKTTAPVDYTKMNVRFYDPDHFWTGYSYRVRSLYYNAKKLKPEEVPTYEELADPKWKGRLCTRNMDQKYNYAFVGWFIAKNGPEKALEWVKGIHENAIQPDKGGDRDQAAKILTDQCDLAIANSYYFSDLLINPKTRAAAADRLGIMIPSQTNGGAFALVNGVAILKQAKQVELANQFVAHLESYMSQRWLADKITVYPVRRDIEPTGLLETYGEAANVNVFPVIEPTPISKSAAQYEQAKSIINKAGYVH